MMPTPLVQRALVAIAFAGLASACGSKDPVVTDPVCGNAIVESGEQCDDGNTQSGDGCSSICQTEQPCTGDDCSTPAVCGNGAV